MKITISTADSEIANRGIMIQMIIGISSFCKLAGSVSGDTEISCSELLTISELSEDTGISFLSFGSIIARTIASEEGTRNVVVEAVLSLIPPSLAAISQPIESKSTEIQVLLTHQK